MSLEAEAGLSVDPLTLAIEEARRQTNSVVQRHNQTMQMIDRLIPRDDTKESLEDSLKEIETTPLRTMPWWTEEYNVGLQKEYERTKTKLSELYIDELEKEIRTLDAGYQELRAEDGAIFKKKITHEEAARLKASALIESEDYAHQIETLSSLENPAQFRFQKAFTMTMEGAYKAALQVVDGTFKPDLSNNVSKLANLAIFLPFGGSIAAQIIKSLSKVIAKYKLDEKMHALCDAFHPFTAPKMIAKLSLSITEACKEDIEVARPKIQSNVEKCYQAIMKFAKGEEINSYYFKTPTQFAGHASALAVLKAIYSGEIATDTPKGFEIRLEDWCFSHLKDQEGEKVVEEWSNAFETAIGQVSHSSHCCIS